MIRHSAPLLATLLALILLWAPLPFGGVTPWAAALLAALCGGALLLAATALERPAALRPAVLPAAALAALALLGLLQAAPLPAGLVAALSPEHARLERQAAKLGAPAPGPSDQPSGRPGEPARLTLAAAPTRGAALGWAAAAAAFLAAAVAGQRREHRRWLAGALLAGALFQVLFGARDWFARATSLWGVELHASATRLRGTFVNPNHLAVYLEMALPVAFAWSWWAARRARDQQQLERRLLLVVPPAMLWLTLFAGLSFTGSRGGLLAAVVAVAVQGVLAAGLRRSWWLAPLGAVVALSGLAVVAAIGRQEGLGRLLATSAADGSWSARLLEYRAALGLWPRFPFTGSGLGTFRDAFPLVQPMELHGTWWHPHGDVLEVLVTAGLVGTALLAAGLWGVARRLVAVLRQGNRSEDRAAALAALGVLISLGIHENLDFGLSMPGNAVTLAALLGAVTLAKTRQSSAQLDAAGQDLAAVQAVELEQVEPGGERRRQPQHRRRSGHGAHRKSAQGGAVEP
jgi:O-antigen ligase